MSKHIPPVPPAGRSDKGPGGSPEAEEGTPPPGDKHHVTGNLAEKDHQGNIKQNTSHQGNQQDR